jgi:hypothetical protein
LAISTHFSALQLTSIQCTFRGFSPHFYSFHFTPFKIGSCFQQTQKGYQRSELSTTDNSGCTHIAYIKPTASTGKITDNRTKLKVTSWYLLTATRNALLHYLLKSGPTAIESPNLFRVSNFMFLSQSVSTLQTKLQYTRPHLDLWPHYNGS